MAVILGQDGASLLDEFLADILDEAGPPGIGVNAQSTMSFQASTSVTTRATMEFEAGQPVTREARAAASDPWTSMYPG